MSVVIEVVHPVLGIPVQVQSNWHSETGVTRAAANLVRDLEQFLRDSVPLGCQVHPAPYEHRPTPLRLVVHHIQPLGMGGLNTPVNWIVTDDTGHYNMHRLQGYLLRGLKLPRQGTDREREMAQLGYDGWVQAGKPGRPVFEVW